ncbi:hypothetical protein ACHQM5_011810 [Ranunculus cassubicifolius]
MEEHQLMDADLASKAQDSLSEKLGNVTASDIVPSAQKENKKKDKDMKKEKKGDKQKTDTKKKEKVQKNGAKKSTDKQNKEKKIKKGKDESSSSSSSSSSESDEDQPKPKKAKNKDTWIWWGILGGLVLVIGGVLKIVNASKEQQVDGQRQVKHISKVERQVPLVLEEHGEREITQRDLQIEALTITDIGNISGVQLERPVEELNHHATEVEKPTENVDYQANQIDKPIQVENPVLHDLVNTKEGNLNTVSDLKKKDKKEKKDEKKKGKKEKDETKDKKEKKNKDKDKKQEKENKHDKEKKKHK